MKVLGVLGAVIQWSAVMALLYMCAYCILMAVVRADGAYAAFSVAFGACAFWIASSVVREGNGR